MSPTDPPMGEHYRPTDGAVTDGIYRVVGTPGDEVTLLRVGDADDQRVHSGVVVTVDSLAGFDAAENPDGNRPLGAKLAGAGRSTYWSVRAFGQSLAANPLATAAFGTLFLTGAFGPQLFSTTGPLFDGLIFAGAFGLVYVGSGRL